MVAVMDDGRQIEEENVIRKIESKKSKIQVDTTPIDLCEIPNPIIYTVCLLYPITLSLYL